MTFYCKRCSQDNKRGLHADTDTWLLTTAPLLCYSRFMAPSDRQLLDALSRTPFVDSAELALILGEPHTTVHRTLAGLLAPGIVGLRSHVEFHRRGRFDATITLHDGRSFGIVRQGLALRRRSLYDRLRAIADATPGPAQRPPQLHPVPGPPRPGPGTCAALTATPRPA